MWWVALGFTIVASVLAHALLTRLAPNRNTVFLFLLGGTAMGAALVAWNWRTFGLLSFETLVAALAYAAFCELYLFLFTLALASISANILARLATGPRIADELNQLYDSSGMVEQRLVRMAGSGLIELNGTNVRLTGCGTTVVHCYRALRRFFRHESAGKTLRIDS
jgi:hypothetical protein